MTRFQCQRFGSPTSDSASRNHDAMLSMGGFSTAIEMLDVGTQKKQRTSMNELQLRDIHRLEGGLTLKHQIVKHKGLPVLSANPPVPPELRQWELLNEQGHGCWWITKKKRWDNPLMIILSPLFSVLVVSDRISIYHNSPLFQKPAECESTTAQQLVRAPGL